MILPYRYSIYREYDDLSYILTLSVYIIKAAVSHVKNGDFH